MEKRRARCSGIVFLALMLIGTAFSNVDAAGDTVQVDVSLPLTGSGAFLGKAQADMLGVLEGLVNRSGGIGGRSVKFAIQDDQTSPQVGVQIVNGVIARHGPVLMGSAIVAICNAMAPIAGDRLLHYCLSTAFHPEDGSLGFSSGVSSADQIRGGVRYLHDRGLKRVAVLTSTDATGLDADNNIDAAFAQPENAGETIVAHEHFGVGDVTVSAQMAHIRAANAEAIIGWTTGSGTATLFRGVNEAGISVPFIAGSGNTTYAAMKAYASIMPRNVYFPATPALVPDSLPNGPQKRAVLEYRNALVTAGLHPDLGNAFGWDQARMIVEAFRKYGPNATPAQIREFIVNSHWRGIAGTYDFKAYPQRGIGINTVMMVQWRPDKEDWVSASRPGGGLK
jgi:branched-chain amino acid transport system substrate-binding protein